MARRESVLFLFFVVLVLTAALPANAQSFRVQCPTTTITHPNVVTSTQGEPAYNGPTQFSAPTAGVPAGTTGDFVTPVPGTVNGAIKCQQISGGDGYMTEADGTQTFMFAFGPLSGLADVAAGRPSTQFPDVFNTPYPGCLSPTSCSTPLLRGDPAPTNGASSGASPWTFNPVTGPMFTWNGAVGLTPDIATLVSVTNLIEGPFPATTPPPRPPAVPLLPRIR